MNIRLLVLSGLFLATTAFITRASRPEPTPAREPLSGLPMRLGSWEGRQAPDLEERVRAVLGVDDYLNRVYVGPGQAEAGLYVGYYQSQREGDTMHSPLNCLPGAGWNPVRKNHISIPVENRPGNPIEVNRITILKGLDKQLVLYWYQSHGRVVASEYWGKIYTVLDALRTNRTDAALVRVICPVSGLEDAAEEKAVEQGTDFVRNLFPELTRFLPE
jgi:EpsI family protein